VAVARVSATRTGERVARTGERAARTGERVARTGERVARSTGHGAGEGAFRTVAGVG
jgi:hypothetical protein